ncbi:MAG: peptidylprolyl isomerase [Adlercreutzia equolifaciens]
MATCLAPSSGRLPQHPRGDSRAGGRRPRSGHGPLRYRQPGLLIKEEFTTNPNNSHEDGALAMARSMDPNSAGSQFYLCLGPPALTWTPGIPWFGPDHRGQGRHRRAARRRCHRVRRHRERRRVSTAPRERPRHPVRAVSALPCAA